MVVPIAPSMIATRSARSRRSAVSAAVGGRAGMTLVSILTSRFDDMKRQGRVAADRAYDVKTDRDWACVSGRAGGLVPLPAVLYVNSRETGKAVQTGHSCAAVTHHRPIPADRSRAKPIGQ